MARREPRTEEVEDTRCTVGVAEAASCGRVSASKEHDSHHHANGHDKNNDSDERTHPCNLAVPSREPAIESNRTPAD